MNVNHTKYLNLLIHDFYRTREAAVSVFHISGRSQQDGGDNPAFSRTDETCGGEWVLRRAHDTGSNYLNNKIASQ